MRKTSSDGEEVVTNDPERLTLALLDFSERHQAEYVEVIMVTDRIFTQNHVIAIPDGRLHILEFGLKDHEIFVEFDGRNILLDPQRQPQQTRYELRSYSRHLIPNKAAS